MKKILLILACLIALTGCSRYSGTVIGFDKQPPNWLKPSSGYVCIFIIDDKTGLIEIKMIKQNLTKFIKTNDHVKYLDGPLENGIYAIGRIPIQNIHPEGSFEKIMKATAKKYGRGIMQDFVPISSTKFEGAQIEEGWVTEAYHFGPQKKKRICPTCGKEDLELRIKDMQ